ncbi:trehalose operon repressor [uncultured Allobaculum sp.]|uniref:trehalose operon repressor n=1 Tax=uncultured Allobaculum sp. TaxID=1187017 RepID=UPI00260E1E7C|nr:trehalose operon repressor [uncultured Allobaculum sp.]
MSKYIEIAREISKRITSKRYPADSYLPSENELCEEFGASRDTVRKALNLLAERKRILKEKKGSRVLPVDIVTFPTSGLISFKELAAHSSQEIETDVIQFGLIDDPVILEKLSMPEGSKAVQIIRIRTYDKERIIEDRDYLNPGIIPGLTPEIAQNSLYEYIEQTLRLPIGFARKEITVEPASAFDAEHMDLNGNTLLVVVRSNTYLEDARLFEYTESRHRPDKFRFIDFSLRERL